MKGPLLITAAAVLWSLGGAGIKFVQAPSMAIAGWRSLLAAPILLVFCGANLRRARWDARMLFTAVAYALTLGTLVAATKLTTAANAILLQYTAPIWLAILGTLVPGAERATRREAVVCVFGFAALSLFFLDQLSTEGLLGILLALGSGLSFAVLTLGLRSAASSGATDPIPSVLLGNLLLSGFCVPWMIDTAGTLRGVEWQVLAGLGTFQIGLPYILYTWAVKYVSGVRATLLAMLEPVLNPVLVALTDGETPGPWAMAGGGILLLTLLADTFIPRSRGGEVSP